MHIAQQLKQMRMSYNLIKYVKLQCLFVHSSDFEDAFNLLFTNFNLVVKFLFYLTNNKISKGELFDILQRHERGDLFSILYEDLNINVSIVEFIQTLFKIGEMDFLRNEMVDILMLYLNRNEQYIRRLLNICIKKIHSTILSEHEQQMLRVKRILSMEKIFDTCIEEEFVLPYSNK